MCSNAQAGAVTKTLLSTYRQHTAIAVQQHIAMVKFVIKVQFNSQAITAANAAINKGRLPQHESGKRCVPESD